MNNNSYIVLYRHFCVLYKAKRNSSRIVSNTSLPYYTLFPCVHFNRILNDVRRIFGGNILYLKSLKRFVNRSKGKSKQDGYQNQLYMVLYYNLFRNESTLNMYLLSKNRKLKLWNCQTFFKLFQSSSWC